MNPVAYQNLLTRELQQPHLGWVLDDAVTGAGIFYELLGDYGLSPDNPDHRRILRHAIDAALLEGF
jgi:hypothetical protein